MNDWLAAVLLVLLVGTPALYAGYCIGFDRGESRGWMAGYRCLENQVYREQRKLSRSRLRKSDDQEQVSKQIDPKP